ncbi:conserved hypothetical protein [Gammaproteobacteria bacterium]
MFDDQSEVDALLQQMREELPIPAYITTASVNRLQRNGAKITAKKLVYIEGVDYFADHGGICCFMRLSKSGEQIALISLTHLRIEGHLLSDKIHDYQAKREKNLAIANGNSPIFWK